MLKRLNFYELLTTPPPKERGGTIDTLPRLHSPICFQVWARTESYPIVPYYGSHAVSESRNPPYEPQVVPGISPAVIIDAPDASQLHLEKLT